MEQAVFYDLFGKMVRNQCAPGELDRLLDFMEQEDNRLVVTDWIRHHYEATAFQIPAVSDAGLQHRLQQRLENILLAPQEEETPVVPVTTRRRLWRWPAAAILLIGLAVAAWYWSSQNKTTMPPAIAALKDVAPGKDGAILTLADGSTIVLDSLGAGMVAHQNGADIALKNGQLIYRAAADDGYGMVYNTMTTPRGRQFKLLLPDQTQVWLNAASSIRYPTHFTGEQRKVEITGEAYLEVANDPKHPFIVSVDGGMDVQVLGTSFNINAYKDESGIITTLLEGSIKAVIGSSDQREIPLKPGQQLLVRKQVATPGAQTVQQEVVLKKEADLRQVLAWKNGFFSFRGADLYAVMRQLSRWYNISVSYEGNIPPMQFGGEMGRNLSLSQVLRLLEKSDVHFRIMEDNRILVFP